VKNREWFLVLILILLPLFLFGFNLGLPSLWDESEAMYCEVAREILQTGDWITMHFNFQEWFIHPPFYMWLTALTAKFIGWSELVCRLWAAIFGVGSVLATYYLGKDLFQKKVGFFAGLIMATTLQIIIASRIGVMDSALNFLVTISILLFYKGNKTGKDIYYLLGVIAASFAVLTKGPIGIILPVLIAFVYLLLAKEFKSLKFAMLLKAAAVFLIIVAPWYIAEYLRHGGEFIKYCFGYQSFGRFFGSVEAQSGPWYYYLGIIPLGFLPWTAFLPASLIQLFRSRAKKESLLLFVWMVVVLVLFSVAGTKLPNYILFIYPALSIVVAKFVCDYIYKDGEQSIVKGMHFSFVLLLLIVSLMVFAAYRYLQFGLQVEYIENAHIFSALAYVVIIGTSLSFVLFLFGKKRYSAFLAIIFTVCLMIWTLSVDILPVIEQYKPIKALATEVKGLMHHDEQLACYKTSRIASIVYYMGSPVIWIEKEDSLNAFVEQKNDIYYYIMRKNDYSELKNKKSLYLIGQKADMLLLSKKKGSN